MFGILFFFLFGGRNLQYELYYKIRTPTEIKKKKPEHCEITV